MAFHVKELMVTVEPARIACPTASATIVFCATTGVQCLNPSALDLAGPDTRRNLELLRRDLAARRAN